MSGPLGENDAVGLAPLPSSPISISPSRTRPSHCTTAKYFYQVWRPVTAIRLGNTGCNPAIQFDPNAPNWTPLAVTAADPSYPGAHSTISEAAACGVRAFPGDFPGPAPPPLVSQAPGRPRRVPRAAAASRRLPEEMKRRPNRRLALYVIVDTAYAVGMAMLGSENATFG
jgi:hypothetical protein